MLVEDIYNYTKKQIRDGVGLIDLYCDITKQWGDKFANNFLIDELIQKAQKGVEAGLVIKKDYRKRYTWGTPTLDDKFAIIKRTDFIVIAAKRASGKTTYSFDMACKNARRGHKVLYISLEMEHDEILEDFARKYAGITIQEEYDYKIPDKKVLMYQRRLGELDAINNLYFEGVRRGGSASWEGILKLINKYDELDLVYIDNLDLVEGNRGESDIDRQKRIVKSIMNFTSKSRVPLVLIHHYRKSGQGTDKGMDELAGSGKISDGADRVLKISRNQNPDAEYPENIKSVLYLQKARGYSEAVSELYFDRGTFVDEIGKFKNTFLPTN